jgi:hypothetical protein
MWIWIKKANTTFKIVGYKLKFHQGEERDPSDVNKIMLLEQFTTKGTAGHHHQDLPKKVQS